MFHANKKREKYEDKYKYCMLFLDVVGPMTEQCDADKLSYRANPRYSI